jgi:hypothetical protein
MDILKETTLDERKTWHISICFISSWFLFCRSSTKDALAKAISTVLSASRRAASLDHPATLLPKDQNIMHR